MDSQQLQQPHHQVTMSRFVAACQADERVVAAFLGGSYARGTADACSDLDLYLVTTDEAYDDFFAGRQAFIRLLGEPVSMGDFNGYSFDLVTFIFADGTEGELAFGRESHFTHISGTRADMVSVRRFRGYAPHLCEPGSPKTELPGCGRGL